ncbi:MAG: PE family protein [Mycobacterium sp.]|uniref:PE family protein n=1 Tax=Mycobacterium sp. TaxID=1785 RepID=UPI003F95197C
MKYRADCLEGKVNIASRWRLCHGIGDDQVEDPNMSYVMAAPDMMAAAATDVAAVGSTLSVAHVAAAAPTVAVIPAAADEVSASIAHLFSRHAQDYQGLAGRAAAFHEQFVQHMNASTGSYAAAEAAGAASLQHLNANAASAASAVAAVPGQVLNNVTNFLDPLVTFAFDLAFLSLELLLVPLNFFVFLINSGVPLEVFGILIFPGF